MLRCFSLVRGLSFIFTSYFDASSSCFKQAFPLPVNLNLTPTPLDPQVSVSSPLFTSLLVVCLETLNRLRMSRNGKGSFSNARNNLIFYTFNKGSSLPKEGVRLCDHQITWCPKTWFSIFSTAKIGLPNNLVPHLNKQKKNKHHLDDLGIYIRVKKEWWLKPYLVLCQNI